MSPSSVVLRVVPRPRAAGRVSRDGRRGAVAPLRVGEGEGRGEGDQARDGGFAYEDEGSERVARGAVAVGAGAWWSAALSLPEGEASEGGALFLRLERHGLPPAGYRGEVEAELLLPVGEIDAVVVLVAGVVAQARRGGVLPSARAS